MKNINNPQLNQSADYSEFNGTLLMVLCNLFGWFAFFNSDGFAPFVITGLIVSNVHAFKWIMRAK